MKDPQYVVEGTKDAHLHIQTIQYPDLRHMIDIENEVVGEVVGQLVEVSRSVLKNDVTEETNDIIQTVDVSTLRLERRIEKNTAGVVVKFQIKDTSKDKELQIKMRATQQFQIKKQYD